MNARAVPPTRRWWPWLRRALTAAFFIAVAALLITRGRTIDWAQVGHALREVPPQRLLEAAAWAALAHALYATYDLLGRRWTHHTLPAAKVMAITFVSYAFNLNLGSWVGGFAFRYRLYSRFGLGIDTVTRVLGLSLATNWLGHLAIGGTLFALGVITPPASWPIGVVALRVFGVLLVALAAGYLLVCMRARRRAWRVRGHLITLPPGALAWRQLAVSCAHWLSVGAVVYALLQGRLPYPMVLGTLLVAAVAGVLAHIPAGLGVLEAVFVAVLGDRMPAGELIAALLAYRALYYLLPLLLASALFFALEHHARQPSVTRATVERHGVSAGR